MRQLTMLKVRPQNMKHIATVALMLHLGVAGIYAQTGPLNMPVSGTAADSTISLRPGTITSEYQLAGNSRLGQFDLRTVSVSIPSPQQPENCSGPNKLSGTAVAGGGVFRFADGGDLLTVNHRGERLHRFDRRACALHQGF